MSIGSSKTTQPITATSLPLPTGAASDGTDITTPTAMPTGGAGIRGWLSAIWTKLNGSLAVTGTFWQATQPISGSVTVSSAPTTAVTGTFFQATQPVSATQLPAALAAGGGMKVEGIAGGVAQPVSIASMPTTAVTGPLTDTQLRATAVPVSGTVAVTGPLTDTQLRATAVPVSGPLTDTQLRATAVPVSLATLPTLAAGTNNIGDVDVLTLPALAAGSNTIGTTLGPTLTKSTQGSTGYSVQDLKDAGRSSRVITLDSFAVAATAETIMTMSYSADNGVVTTGTSYTVTAGKRLRIQQVEANLHTIAGNTTAVAVIVRIRTIATAPALVGSPLQLIFPVQGVAAANQAGMSPDVTFPDGWELPAGAGLAVTVTCPGFVATTAAPKVDITITGYEY